MTTHTSTVRLIGRHSFNELLQQKTVWLFVILFVLLVMMSAYLGWSANTTVDSIYTDAKQYLIATGATIPPNPVLDNSPLSMLRNLTVYFGLIGVLVAIVMGYQLIAEDRKSGVLPLIASRIRTRGEYTLAKIAVFSAVLAGLTALSLLICSLVLALLPSISVSVGQWIHLFEFHLLAYSYMLTFGFLTIGCTTTAKKQSIALLIPVSIWLIVTFILPSLTTNINPTAAINPISTLAAVPDSEFFSLMSRYLAPVSLAQNFDALSAQLLEYGSPSNASPFIPMMSLIGGMSFSALFAVKAVRGMKMEKGDFNE